MRRDDIEIMLGRALAALGLLPLLMLCSAALDQPLFSTVTLVPAGCLLLTVPLWLVHGKYRVAFAVLLPLLSLLCGILLAPLRVTLSGEYVAYYALCLALPLLGTVTNENGMRAMQLFGVVAHVLAAFLTRMLIFAPLIPALRVVSPAYIALLVLYANGRELRARCASTGRRPSRKMTLGNLALSAALFLLMLAAAYFDALRRAAEAVLDFFKRVIMWLVSLLPDMSSSQGGGAPEAGSDMLAADAAEASPFWLVLQYIAYGLAALMALYLLYRLCRRLPALLRRIGRALRALLQRYLGAVGQQDYTDVEERLDQDDGRDGAKKRKRRIGADDALADTSDSRIRVRRAYLCMIKKSRVVKPDMTAREAIGLLGGPDALSRSYERARYSSLPVTREEADEAALIAKQKVK